MWRISAPRYCTCDGIWSILVQKAQAGWSQHFLQQNSTFSQTISLSWVVGPAKSSLYKWRWKFSRRGFRDSRPTDRLQASGGRIALLSNKQGWQRISKACMPYGNDQLRQASCQHPRGFRRLLTAQIVHSTRTPRHLDMLVRRRLPTGRTWRVPSHGQSCEAREKNRRRPVPPQRNLRSDNYLTSSPDSLRPVFPPKSQAQRMPAC
jgi:hypothetical protein